MDFEVSSFTLKSYDVEGQVRREQLYPGPECRGENVSPQLFWVNPPEGTQSYAVTMFDPDAPSGSGWWHWIVFDIPAGTEELAAGAGNPHIWQLPEGAIQIRNDYGEYGYGGPCPPAGETHAYILTVYALDVPSLNLPKEVNGARAGFSIHAHTIRKASLITYYRREK